MLKILGLGNSFSWDATTYLDRVAGDLYVRNLHIGGCSLEMHVDKIKNKNIKGNLKKPIDKEKLDDLKAEVDSYVMVLNLSDEEESYVSVDDEEVLNKVFEIFKEKFKDDFNFVD